MTWFPLSYNPGVGRIATLSEALGQNLFPYLFQLLEATHIPWLINPFFHVCYGLNCVPPKFVVEVPTPGTFKRNDIWR